MAYFFKYLENTILSMKRAFLSHFLFLLFTTLSLNSYSQQTEKGLWSSLELKRKLGKSLNLSFEEEYRQVDQLGSTDQFMTSIDLSTKVVKHIKAGVSYTLINKYKPTHSEPWDIKHRGSFYVTGTTKFDRFDFAVREKFQSTYKVGGIEDEDTSNPVNVLRTKMTLTYNIKGLPINPYVSSEFFYTLNEPDGAITNGSVSKFTESRWGAGFEYSMSKKISASIGYLYSDGFEWDTYSITGVRYGHYINNYKHVITVGLNVTL